MNTIAKLFLSAVAVILAAYFIPGVHLSGFVAALVFAVVLAVVNLILRPLLLILTLPINILTLGLFTLVVNAVLILIVVRIVPGIAVDGFVSALLFGLILAIVEAVLHTATKKRD
jgi:putative membrane protein